MSRGLQPARFSGDGSAAQRSTGKPRLRRGLAHGIPRLRAPEVYCSACAGAHERLHSRSADDEL